MKSRARAPSNRVAPEGAAVAPLNPTDAKARNGSLAAALNRHASHPAPPERDYAVEIEEGLLVCQECGRWFPITGRLPELLPDHLRDPARDDRILEQCAQTLPADLIAALRQASPPRNPPDGSDTGAGYKRNEITIKSKIDDPGFFAPGYSSPFNPHDTGFTVYLIKLFGAAVPLLDLKGGDVLVDSGCGYSWTTEWLFRAGVEAIGVDICRTYLEVGIERMGPDRPHLVVGDVEYLPLRTASADAVFAYESFHHVPDRNRAMAGYSRVLKHGGRAVLAEPGAAHEDAQVSIDVMKRYGILEKGMELGDVQQYIEGTALRRPEQIFLLRASDGELGGPLDSRFVRTHSAVEGNLFRMHKSDGPIASIAAAAREPRRVVWPKVKRRVKATLAKLGLE
jgi:SAM-dependent methyltransferase/uncharacterized protein YbaR (Trm112 family)